MGRFGVGGQFAVFLSLLVVLLPHKQGGVCSSSWLPQTLPASHLSDWCKGISSTCKREPECARPGGKGTKCGRARTTAGQATAVLSPPSPDSPPRSHRAQLSPPLSERQGFRQTSRNRPHAQNRSNGLLQFTVLFSPLPLPPKKTFSPKQAGLPQVGWRGVERAQGKLGESKPW